MQDLIDRVAGIVEAYPDEHVLTPKVAEALTEALARGLDLPAATTRPNPDRYVMYPLYIADDESFSIASAVWDVGQGTPVHGHETWGVVGIYSGQEHELSFVKPTVPDVPLIANGEHVWKPGEVTVCCTTDDDVHQVRCEGDAPVIGIHIYGGNIGTIERRSYEPETGRVDWFVSNWGDTD
ncbi:putative metal-dependent enzyme (double-stranded beta helix superfamily) [Antricoccus suffuscus]|uniref:Putative metal-dependent enzyme (Double-stranded beta helix superfamily) n=1 Tax=Antricoccus suffuscus TaxID=1629062 RepID=A0A2T0ZX80_9ACTN|nr:hypothetical protein [Antricoccus suffuscus]PRZ40847.1 putative metal-dependent enzyme (double-stranded beta helix superfamily) [Antricoccus suffuscus]